MNQSVLTPEQRAAYDRDGFVMVRGLFDPEEALLLQKAMETVIAYVRVSIRPL
jgi:hypothetical protein